MTEVRKGQLWRRGAPKRSGGNTWIITVSDPLAGAMCDVVDIIYIAHLAKTLVRAYTVRTEWLVEYHKLKL